MSFPQLPAIDAVDNWLRSRADGKHELGDAFLVAVQHRLSTTGSLIAALLAHGWTADRIFLAGKPYSDNAAVVSDLERLGINIHRWSSDWRPGFFGDTFDAEIAAFCETLPPQIYDGSAPVVLLDDGGRLIRAMMARMSADTRVAAVEQTTSGIEKITDATGRIVPTVMVATSRAKIVHESPMIASKTLEVLKASGSLPPAGGRVGVVGVGAIGSSMAEALFREGYELALHDLKGAAFLARQMGAWTNGDDSALPSKISIENDIGAVVESCQLVLGASGQDLSAAPAMISRSGTTVLGSCSSEDVEWRTMLRDVRETVLTQGNFRRTLETGAGFGILNGGFPLNFTGARDSVPPANIQLTRALLYAAIHEAGRLASGASGNEGGSVCLNPEIEGIIVDSWKRQSPAAAR